jgi:uncharacterized spore protein YtfJ
MELQFKELLSQITDFLKSETNTDTVIGKQFDLGEFKCVPVIKVGMGFGSGGGEGAQPKNGSGMGGGAGAGMGIKPIGFLVTREKEISFLAAGKTHGISAIFEKIPDLIEKITENKAKEKATT